MENCVFLDTAAQEIIVGNDAKGEKFTIEHTGWVIAVDQKELNKIFAAATKPVLSPFSYLFLQYEKEKPKHTLYVLIADENIYIATFDEDLPVYWKIVPLSEEKNIEQVIEHALKEFYRQEKTYFIEKVIIYRFSNLMVVVPDEVEQKLFLEVQLVQKDYGDVCEDKDVERYTALPTIEKKEKSFWERNRVAILLFLLIFAGLVAIDFFLKFKTKKLNEQATGYIQQQVQLANETNNYTKKMLQSQKIDPILERIKESNAQTVERIKNVFSLIPDDAYLTAAAFSKEGVQLEGVALHAASIKKALAKSTQKLTLEKTKRGYRFRVADGDAIHAVH